MMRALRRKLIVATMLSLTVVLTVILGGVNLMSRQKLVGEADAILAVLAENQGSFPHRGFLRDPLPQGPTWTPGMSPAMSPETPYESRYFSVLLDADGQILQTDTGQVAAIDDAAAADAAAKILATGRTTGFWEQYRYLRSEESDGTRLIFLNCTRSLSSLRTTLLYSIALALLGLGTVLVLLLLLSQRIIRPVAESYEKQKRFITDAGHELKTPLTIISADTDLAEVECGENQWLTDIRRQAQRLTGLTHDLIFLSRMEEQPQLQLLDFPLSDLVEETAQSFLAPAKSQGKALSLSIQPLLSCTGDEKSLRQLLSILLDNALRYAADGAVIAVELQSKGRNVLLRVSNPMARPLDKAALEHLFERFYRGDAARSAGGYGLGLSIARSIVAAHRGKIRAECPDGVTLTMAVTLHARQTAGL